VDYDGRNSVVKIRNIFLNAMLKISQLDREIVKKKNEKISHSFDVMTNFDHVYSKSKSIQFRRDFVSVKFKRIFNWS